MTINASADRGDRPIRLGGRVMSRRRLAHLTGVDPTHIGMIFSGRRNPSLALAAKIAETFGVSIDELYGRLNGHDEP